MSAPVRPPGRGTADVVAEALRAQRAYEERRSTRFGRGAERFTRPLGGTFARVVPPEMVRAGLRAADGIAGATLPEIAEHDPDDFAACEAAALKVQAWAAGTNAATGAASGWFGAAGMTADIPATLALAARNVRATGLAYGLRGGGAEETAFRLIVLEAATTHAEDGRRKTLDDLNRMAAWLSSPEGRFVLEKGGEWVTEKVVERVARQLGITFAGRKAGQVVPIVGGAVAAVVNASFQTDVSRAARYAYRQRWLMARRLLPVPPETAQDA
jgi:hypothetical protein